MSYQELLQLTERFLLQQDVTHVLLDKETKSEFVKESKESLTRPQQSQKLPAPLAPVQKNPVPQVKTAAPIAVKAVEKKVNEAPKTEAPATPTKVAAPHGIPCIPKPFARGNEPNFADIYAKIGNPHAANEKISDAIAHEKANSWKLKAPKIVLFSFFSKSSPKAQFIETIRDAIDARIGACRLYHLPELESLAELYIFAQHGLLKACLLASDAATQAKANEFLLPLNLEEETSREGLFSARSRLYQTPLFDIAVSDSLPSNVEEKRLLWNHLKSL